MSAASTTRVINLNRSIFYLNQSCVKEIHESSMLIEEISSKEIISKIRSFMPNLDNKIAKQFNNIYRILSNALASKKDLERIKKINDEQMKAIEKYLKKNGINTKKLKDRLKEKKQLTPTDLDLIIEMGLIELKHTTAKDFIEVVAFVLVAFILNTFIIYSILDLIFFINPLANYSQAMMVAVSIGAVLSAPFVEEAGKRVSIERKKGLLYIIGFNIAEYTSYVSAAAGAGLGYMIIMMIVRLLPVAMHFSNYSIHQKGDIDQKIADKYKISTERDFRQDAQRIAMTIHRFWNIGLIFLAPLAGWANSYFSNKFPVKKIEEKIEPRSYLNEIQKFFKEKSKTLKYINAKKVIEKNIKKNIKKDK